MGEWETERPANLLAEQAHSFLSEADGAENTAKLRNGADAARDRAIDDPGVRSCQVETFMLPSARKHLARKHSARESPSPLLKRSGATIHKEALRRST